jgi:hypothetical protein
VGKNGEFLRCRRQPGLKKVGECVLKKDGDQVTNPGQDWYLKFERLKTNYLSWQL